MELKAGWLNMKAGLMELMKGSLDLKTDPLDLTLGLLAASRNTVCASSPLVVCELSSSTSIPLILQIIHAEIWTNNFRLYHRSYHKWMSVDMAFPGSDKSNIANVDSNEMSKFSSVQPAETG